MLRYEGKKERARLYLLLPNVASFPGTTRKAERLNRRSEANTSGIPGPPITADSTTRLETCTRSQQQLIGLGQLDF